MQLRESIKQTKNYFHKTIKNLASFFLGGYQKLPKPPLFNPFLCSSSRNWKNHQTDQFYADFYNDWESDLQTKKHSVVAAKEPIIEEDVASRGSFMKFAKQSPVKNKQEERRKDEKNTKILRIGKREEQYSKRMKQEGGQVLAQKMKELEMMDAGDVEHVLDIEEAIHYYSRLKSPVYIDIVDKFLTDMYTEITVPQASVSVSNSKRKFGSMRL